MTQFRLHFPNDESGSRIDAWAHYGSAKMLNRKGVVPDGGYEVWFTQPSHRAEQGRKGLPSLKVARKHAGHRAVEVVGDSVWKETTNFLREYGSGLLRPTTGLTALSMAIDRRPYGLVICGFDATIPKGPGWGDYTTHEEWRVVQTHDHVAEKRMIADLVDEHVWCGRPVTSKVRWLGRPKL